MVQEHEINQNEYWVWKAPSISQLRHAHYTMLYVNFSMQHLKSTMHDLCRKDSDGNIQLMHVVVEDEVGRREETRDRAVQVVT